MVLNTCLILLGALLIALILFDAFETIILPRGITRTLRLASRFYTVTWRAWRWAAERSRTEKTRETVLSYFGPMSLLLLLVLWGFCLILGFSLIHWSVSGSRSSFATNLYMSGTTFFTLGLGDVTPHSTVDRVITVVEAGVGFGFLAIVIGYLPVLYQAFSRREVAISLLDARAGSPPTAAEILARHGLEDGGGSLNQLLRDWELWSAELLESHMSFPVLCYYRSQHDRQSWIAALTAILDTCALVLTGMDGVAKGQAQRTFAIARHAAVDLAAIFEVAPDSDGEDRLPQEEWEKLDQRLRTAGCRLPSSPEALAQLRDLRELYEPYVCCLATRMAFALPPFTRAEGALDAWQTTAWHASEHR